MEKKFKNRPKTLHSPKRLLATTLSSSSSTGSTATMVRKNFIPDFVNNNNLRNHLHRSFDTRGEKQLGKIMNFNRKAQILSRSTKRRTFSCDFDSNDLIIQEFLHVSDKNIWSAILKNFQSNPKGLINLITINQNKSPKKSRKLKNKSSMKPIFKTSDQADSEEDEVITFKSSKFVPEDWSKSLLYWKVKASVYGNTLSKEDIQKFLNNLPRTQEGLIRGIDKGLGIIENFLLEMLGTEDDMNNFKMGLSVASLSVYDALFEKCLSFVKMRKKAVKIMKFVLMREELIEKMKLEEVGRRDAIVRICLINKQLKPLLVDWTQDPTIPFSSFKFKNENYLKKMQKDTLSFQKYLIHFST